MKILKEKYSKLDWDSSCLNYRVAKILTEDFSYDELKDILDESKRVGISLVYAGVRSGDTESIKAAEALNGYFTGQKVIYAHSVDGESNDYVISGSQLQRYAGDAPNEELMNLMMEGGARSRFGVDPKISQEQYRRLMKQWITDSVRDNDIFTIRKNEKIVGFISLNERNNRGNIDFIAVDKDFRGKGLGRSLLFKALEWCTLKGYDFIQAVTQKENTVACKMYEKMGYRVEKTENFYHFWL